VRAVKRAREPDDTGDDVMEEEEEEEMAVVPSASQSPAPRRPAAKRTRYEGFV
jgi:hypothetical protein